MSKKILVVNAGSSSIKLQLFEKDTLKPIASGLTERITLPDGIITIKYNGQKYEDFPSMPNHAVGVAKTLELMKKIKLIENPEEIEAVGFRVVHGGTYFNSSIKLDDQSIALIDKCSLYAPLHNPGAIQAILAFKQEMPKAILTASFDTSFHTTIPNVNAIYPIPLHLSEKHKIKKYGFHGISHNYITNKVEELLNKKSVNVINLHIGSGASICAIKDSKSFDTTMGLTPLAGIMMGTRSGDIDPSIVEFLCKEENLTPQEVTDILNKKSGLLGVSEISNDLRDIEKAIAENNEKAIFAKDLYVQKIVDYVANYANKLENKIDAIVFTAGVGENSPFIRKAVIEKLHFADIQFDDQANNSKYDDYVLLSKPDSQIKIYAIRTNEELLIAQNTLNLIK
ncbi:acetate/propionate family kinase [Mycoplasmopsis columbina]|uniref:Acetate kinase n=1 Tax=Mycoplasmopsis columbina SF7 TaxID=1037410 RepID=F9UKH2_9BACT|nr:acetate/propionate family kinase [Mycoplasmopsis columbina]EGV00177.1 acetate kinase [Mycoplasmopsis columbina SF7]VEU77071.1 acetate kinase [Mycoplasmopsis columbina]